MSLSAPRRASAYFATGARLEECLALRWEDVDFDRGGVGIRRVVQWRRKADGGFYFLPPKTRKSRRTLRVSDSVLRLLRSHRRAQMQQRLKQGARYQPHDLVYASSEGTPFQRNNLRRRHLVPVLEAAKLDTSLPLACATRSRRWLWPGASTRKRSR
jgi:integrase